MHRSLPMLYRATMAIEARDVRRWDVEHAHSRDSAVKVGGTLTAAAQRGAKAEVAVARGKHVLVVAWDGTKYFYSLA